MKKLYVLTLLLYCLSITAASEEVDFQAQRSAYRNQFDEVLKTHREMQDLRHTNTEAKAKLQAQRAKEDFDLQYQRAKEDYATNKQPLIKIRDNEDIALKAKRRKEDEHWSSGIRKLLGRDTQRTKEDEAIQATRAKEDDQFSKIGFKIKDMTDKDLTRIQATSQKIDLLLIDQEFRGIMRKLVDIENYQKVYRDLSIGRLDVASFRKVQQSLHSDITLSSQDRAIIKKNEDEIKEMLNLINSLFDKTDPIYQHIETQFKNEPLIDLPKVTSVLKESIEELKKVDFIKFVGNKGWYVFKESVIALIATPFVSVALGAQAGWQGAFRTTLIGAPLGGIFGAITGAIIGIKAAPLIAAARLVEASYNVQYTITREVAHPNSNQPNAAKFEHTASESGQAIFNPLNLYDSKSYFSKRKKR